ncbi:MAG: LysM peptidoglycan-binding domain-containing protein [Thiogranum sp.]|nr:LysM peptidoglycan-binding domain-containing protein [Thiogranum sp.]
MPGRLLPLLPVAAFLITACGHLPGAPDAVLPVAEAVPGTLDGQSAWAPSSPTIIAAAEPLTGILAPAFAPQQPTDLWEALRSNFALPAQDNERIAVHRRWYASHPEYLRRVSERARRYAWHIQQELETRGMPAEIALLPVVESAYDPFAYSHGRAAGLWQFVPATGKHFGLKQNWWYDGRRDVVDSTTAALDYLEHLHRRFHGDWLLALAAYNSGEGTVIKAQRRNRSKNRPGGYWNLNLPRETREYVPKLLALKQLVEAPEKYGITLNPIPAQAYFEVVDTDAQIDLAVAADLADMQLDTLYRLNPGFNQWATDPEGPHRLLIPVDQVATFRQAIAGLPPEKRLKWIRHKIDPGQTLSHIATRYHTTVDALKAANNLKSAAIRAGTWLMVPVSSQSKENYQLSAQQRLADKKNRSRSGYKTEHIVGSGDTFWDLSRQYKVSVRKLASWNGMAPGDTLRVGQKLVIWTQLPTSGSVLPGTLVRPVYYTVRKGDSLSRISSRFKVTVDDLRDWNNLSGQGYLKPGQRLKLYVDVTRQATGT